MKRYFWNLLISIDQLFNALLGGYPDETISSRAGKREDTCKLCWLMCRFLDLFQKDHCRLSIEKDEGIEELPLNQNPQVTPNNTHD